MHPRSTALALVTSVLLACAVDEDTVTDPSIQSTDGGNATDRGGSTRDVLNPFQDLASRLDSSLSESPPGPSDTGPVSEARLGCGPREICNNRTDDDCNGRVDEGCACVPSAMQECSTLDVGAAGRGRCANGTQRCEGMGEFGAWGQCMGEVGPSPEVCNGMDDDCDGTTDENLSQECYPGPRGTAGVGPCRAGMQVCTHGAPGMCVGAVVPAPEACNNRTDDDCNGMVDDCRPCIMASGSSAGSPWQVHRVMGPVCFGRRFSVHGEPGEFALARIPAEADPSWRPVASATIDFSERSALCGRSCNCLDGGEFTYFQTAFELSGSFLVSSLNFTAAGVDDGAQVTVFNSRYPAGIVEPGSYLRLGAGGATADLARYLVAGRNRIVITHIDDCCSDRSLTGVRVVLNGGALVTCPMP